MKKFSGMLSRKKFNGFTIVEILVAVVIFSTIALASIAYYTYGRRSGIEAKRANYALRLAEDQLELFKSMPYDSVASSAHRVYYKHGAQFTRYYAASQRYSYDENYKVVTVSVTWTSDNGNKKEGLELFTIISP